MNRGAGVQAEASRQPATAAPREEAGSEGIRGRRAHGRLAGSPCPAPGPRGAASAAALALLSSSYSDVLTPRGPADSGVPAPCPHHRGARPHSAGPAHGREHTLWQGPRRPRVRLRAPPPAAPDRVLQPASAQGRHPTASGCLEPAKIVQVSRPHLLLPTPPPETTAEAPARLAAPARSQPVPAWPCGVRRGPPLP